MEVGGGDTTIRDRIPMEHMARVRARCMACWTYKGDEAHQWIGAKERDGGVHKWWTWPLASISGIVRDWRNRGVFSRYSYSVIVK